MGWRLRIEHTTQVTYSGPVLTSFNEARMTPLTLPTQTTLDARVTAGPGAPVWTYSDYWGSYVSVFDLPEAHDGLLIRATAMVETEPFPGIPASRERPGWAELRDQAPKGRLLEFLLPTPLTTVTAEIQHAAMSGVSGLDPDEAAAAISARVREHVTYMPGATGVRTNAQEAWDKGQGVCQDMAQLTVALLRAAGLPARYVSGYLHPDVHAEPGRTAVGQSHAWVEYWAGSWIPLDPTSGAEVGERHVVVARGRDYTDVPPLKGLYHGPPDSDMEVTVEVTRLALSRTGAADSPTQPPQPVAGLPFMFGQLWVECVADGAGVAAAALPESAELVLAVVDDAGAACDVAALATARLPPSPAPSATAPTAVVMMIRPSLVFNVSAS